MRGRWLILGLLVGAAGTAAWAAQDADAEAVWQSDEFKKSFLGAYGINASIEPPIGPEDRKVLELVYPLLGSDPAAAEKLLLESKTATSSANFDMILGNLAFQADRSEEAEGHYRDAVLRFPSFSRAWRMLGLIQARDQRYEDAITSFSKMLALGGADAISLGFLGNAYLAKQDYLAAESAYRQALMLEPANATWRIGLARAVVKQEKYEESASLLAVLIEREPQRSEFWFLQANAFLGMKQPLRAAENLEMVALLGHATTDSYALLGDIYLEEGQLDMASSAYLRGIALDAAQPAARPLRAAESLASRGALPQARIVAGSIRSTFGPALSPEDVLRLDRLEARIAVAAGDGGEAIRLLEEIIARDPLDGETLMLAGQHYQQAGENDRAAVYFERAAGIDGFEAKAKLRQAQLLVGAAKYDEAILLLRRVQEIQPREQVARYLEQVERLARGQG